MGGSSDQVTGYKYVTNFLLFIGNPIEKVLGINFDKRGWLTPLIDEMKNPLTIGTVEKPTLYGENEGGVVGQIYAKYGTDNQQVVPFYKDYMESKELSASAYPYQSYLAFKDFYVGNSGYMKEMLLWPKRIHVRNDGGAQWYDLKAEINTELNNPDNGFDENWKYLHNPVLYKHKSSFDNIWANWTSDYYDNNYHIGFSTSGQSTGVIQLETAAVELSLDYEGLIGWAEIQITLIGEESDIDIVSISWPYEYYYTRKDSSVHKVYSLMLRSNNTAGKLEITLSRTSIPGTGFAATLTPMGVYPIVDPVNEENPDINPIHKIREILTDDTAMNKPESSVNDINFTKAADRIFDEGLGISWSITEKSCIDAINELCYHIEAGIRINRQTGLYEMVLFRDDWFDEDEIHAIPESKIKSMQYEITNADEVINQVNVNYYDRANIKNSSFSISENGLIQTLGCVNAETLDFPYFMNMRNAEIVANWKLKQVSTGAFKGAFTTGWREARKWNRYDLIRLPWSKRWTGTILVRIMSINLGGPTNNEVSIEYIEVVPSTAMMNTTIVADEPIDKPLPPQACEYEPFEMPYYLAAMRLGQRQVDEELAYDSNFGLVGVVAEKPQENSLYAVMMTNNYDEWVRAGSIQYSLTTDSDQFISKTSSSFTVKNWKKISNVPAGTLIQCGKEWLTGLSEWMVFQSVDHNTGVVSVKRGALDTQPKDWDLGLKLYFCGTDISYDQTEYVADEKVLVSALTTTPSGVLEQKGSNLVEMKARAVRPYPPANVKINGEYWPTEIETDLAITWVNRNRLQQTGGEIIGWYEGGVTLESGVTYMLVLTELDENQVELRTQNINVGTLNEYIVSTGSMQANTLSIEIILKSIRDGYECFYPFTHTVELSQFFSAPYDIAYVVSDL
ncbi:phage tail protein [Acinetobacter sp. UNC436CL71CviS28]|uniref:phage tail protein n=1 Tax=Acinetobacter sp. UNC436CL71CviS28 TaxID=1380368 RepID=UPI00047BA3A6|nr:phage tail protein [Acinetobacter sp. UNC436CL71CviS28]